MISRYHTICPRPEGSKHGAHWSAAEAAHGDEGFCMGKLRPFTSAVVFLVAACLVDLRAYAEDTAVPKREFKTREEFAKYREAAWAHFRRRCVENAGERIFRTVEDVRGVFLLKPRRRPTEYELGDQFWADDPYGHDGHGRVEIVSYLADLDGNGIPTVRRTARSGYEFVEMNASGGGVIQYRRDDPRTRPTEQRLRRPESRYGITWTDVSTAQDRHYWIAGGKLQIVDISNGAVLAERIGYLLEAGFGSTSSGRRPWLFARLHYSERACPAFRRHAYINREFVEKVLQPVPKSQDAK